MTLTVIGSFNLTYDLLSFQIEIVLRTLILTITFVDFCIFLHLIFIVFTVSKIFDNESSVMSV